jgi:hypothetical protein
MPAFTSCISTASILLVPTALVAAAY